MSRVGIWRLSSLCTTAKALGYLFDAGVPGMVLSLTRVSLEWAEQVAESQTISQAGGAFGLAPWPSPPERLAPLQEVLRPRIRTEHA